MITKFNIILLLIIVFSTNAFCCLSASQERIIPLGTSENCLIGIEIISNRHGEGEFNSIPVWNHKIALKGFNKDYSDFLIKELSYKVSVPNEKSDSILRLEITKALQHCKILEGFEIFEPKEISFCDFQKDCSAISLVESNNRLEFRINSKNKSYPIQYLSSDYKGQMAKPNSCKKRI